jgi:hypothetical protein
MLSIERQLHEFMGKRLTLAVVINQMQNAMGIVPPITILSKLKPTRV